MGLQRNELHNNRTHADARNRGVRGQDSRHQAVSQTTSDMQV